LAFLGRIHVWPMMLLADELTAGSGGLDRWAHDVWRDPHPWIPHVRFLDSQ